MTSTIQIVKFSCLLMLCAGVTFSCKKSDVTPEDPTTPPVVNKGGSVTSEIILSKKLAAPFKGDSLSLQLLTTTKTGGTGYGRSGGLIHQLDCKTLALIKYDNEGFGRDEVSFFTRITDGDDGWYEL